MEQRRADNKLTQLTEEQKKEIRKTFDMFDADGDGRVCTKEIGTIIRAFFVVANDKQLLAFQQKLDKHDNGYVDYVDFERFMVEEDLTTVTHDEMDDDLHAAFEYFDKDGNGSIDVEEFREAMLSLGDKLSSEEVKTMMEEADTNGDGKIDYKEFCKHMKKNILLG